MKKILMLFALTVIAMPASAMGSKPVDPPVEVVTPPAPVVAEPKPVTTKPATTTTTKKTTTQKKTTAKKVPPTSNVRPEVKAPEKVQRKAVLSKSKQTPKK